MKLTQKLVQSLSEGTYVDEATKGLVLRVRGGYRLWYYRRQVNGRRFDLGLGSAETVTYSKAKAEVFRLAALSPSEFVAAAQKRKEAAAPKEETKTPTFHEACEKYADAQIKLGIWEDRYDKAYRTFESRLRCHVWPQLGDKPVNEITPHDVAEMAAACWQLTDTKDRCISITKVVLDWCRAEGYTDHDNPAALSGPLRFLLPRARPATRNRGALSVDELPHFFAACMAQTQTSSRRCFEFSILTATRSETARMARWEQIDLDAATWTIPAAQLKIKSNGGLVIPLAGRVVEFLRAIDGPRQGLIFPNDKGRLLSDSMISRHIKLTPNPNNPKGWIDHAESLKRGVDVRATQHGIARATFMTWSQDDSLGNDLRFDVRVAHMALHHKLKDIYNGAYERQTLFQRRRELMEAWAEYCFSLVNKKG